MESQAGGTRVGRGESFITGGQEQPPMADRGSGISVTGQRQESLKMVTYFVIWPKPELAPVILFFQKLVKVVFNGISCLFKDRILNSNFSKRHTHPHRAQNIRYISS